MSLLLILVVMPINQADDRSSCDGGGRVITSTVIFREGMPWTPAYFALQRRQQGYTCVSLSADVQDQSFEIFGHS